MTPSTQLSEGGSQLNTVARTIVAIMNPASSSVASEKQIVTKVTLHLWTRSSIGKFRKCIFIIVEAILGRRAAQYIRGTTRYSSDLLDILNKRTTPPT